MKIDVKSLGSLEFQKIMYNWYMDYAHMKMPGLDVIKRTLPEDVHYKKMNVINLDDEIATFLRAFDLFPNPLKKFLMSNEAQDRMDQGMKIGKYLKWACDRIEKKFPDKYTVPIKSLLDALPRWASLKGSEKSTWQMVLISGASVIIGAESTAFNSCLRKNSSHHKSIPMLITADMHALLLLDVNNELVGRIWILPMRPKNPTKMAKGDADYLEYNKYVF